LSTILYLSYDGMTDPLGRSQVLPYLIGLSEKGYRFHLISFEKKDSFHKHSKTVKELTNSAGIEWHPLSYTKNPPVLSTVLDVVRMERKSKELIRQFNIQAVHCRSYISGLVGLRLKRNLGLKFIFDIRGFWADERVEGGLWNLNNRLYASIYRYFKSKERDMFAHADGVVSLTSKAAEFIINHFKVNPANIHVIPCCADLDFFTRTNINTSISNRIRQQTNINHHAPVLGYLGAIGTWYMLDEMLVFFKRLLILKPNAFFLFITPEPAEVIMEKARKIGVPTKHIGVYFASREEVPSALALVDISIFFIRPTFSKTASSPTKQGEIMGMGIPLICNTGIGDTDTVVEKYACGELVDLNDPLSMDQTVTRFDAILSIPKQQIRDGAIDYFSLKEGVNRYETLYKNILSTAITTNQ